METLGIAIIIFVLSLLIAVIIYASKKANTTSIDKDTWIIQNGVKICLSPDEYEQYLNEQKEARQKEKLKIPDFVALNKELEDDIRDCMNSCKDRIKRKVLMEIISIPVNNSNDLEYKTWMFNNGDLRTNEEVWQREWDVSCAKHRENYDSERHFINFIAFFVPFIIVFLLILAIAAIKGYGEILFIIIPIALMPAGVAGIIGGLIGYYINISNASSYGIPDSDPRVQSEKSKLKAAVITSVAGTASVVHHAKKAVKDIGNVDGWKQMK